MPNFIAVLSLPVAYSNAFECARRGASGGSGNPAASGRNDRLAPAGRHGDCQAFAKQPAGTYYVRARELQATRLKQHYYKAPNGMLRITRPQYNAPGSLLRLAKRLSRIGAHLANDATLLGLNHAEVCLSECKGAIAHYGLSPYNGYGDRLRRVRDFVATGACSVRADLIKLKPPSGAVHAKCRGNKAVKFFHSLF